MALPPVFSAKLLLDGFLDLPCSQASTEFLPTLLWSHRHLPTIRPLLHIGKDTIDRCDANIQPLRDFDPRETLAIQS